MMRCCWLRLCQIEAIVMWYVDDLWSKLPFSLEPSSMMHHERSDQADLGRCLSPWRTDWSSLLLDISGIKFATSPHINTGTTRFSQAWHGEDNIREVMNGPSFQRSKQYHSWATGNAQLQFVHEDGSLSLGLAFLEIWYDMVWSCKILSTYSTELL